MDDLISRKAAIDAISCDITVTGRQNAELVAQTIGRFADRIKALPSAQPEIVRCKDCKYQRKGQNECEEWNLCGYRPWQYTPITDEHFCADAERRTDE